MIRHASDADAAAVAAIYNPYVLSTAISFEEQPVSTHEIAYRMKQVLESQLPYLVLENAQSEVVGFAYAGKWRVRDAYRYSVETSIYLDQATSGQGLGGALYGALLNQLRAAKIHAAIAGIALPNQPSVALHEKLGFEKVAHFREVGFKFDRWVDVGYWQLIL